jgi:hypothetical protein
MKNRSDGIIIDSIETRTTPPSPTHPPTPKNMLHPTHIAVLFAAGAMAVTSLVRGQ